MATRVEDMLKAWNAGKVCLHPTDTLPGLSFNPRLPEAERNFMRVKLRAPDKSPISLVGDFDLALRAWAPLPGAWPQILKDLWPSSLSVVWQASSACPAPLLASDGSCGLRMPRWTEENRWMQTLLERLGELFPSSSVNHSGDPAAQDWATAVRFLQKEEEAFIPDHVSLMKSSSSSPSPFPSNLPSTLIRINKDGTWAALREGAVSSGSIQTLWEKWHHAERS